MLGPVKHKANRAVSRRTRQRGKALLGALIDALVA